MYLFMGVRTYIRIQYRDTVTVSSCTREKRNAQKHGLVCHSFVRSFWDLFMFLCPFSFRLVFLFLNGAHVRFLVTEDGCSLSLS